MKINWKNKILFSLIFGALFSVPLFFQTEFIDHHPL